MTDDHPTDPGTDPAPVPAPAPAPDPAPDPLPPGAQEPHPATGRSDGDRHPAMVGHPEPLEEVGGSPVAAAGHPGRLALVGGGEWTAGCSFDEELWDGAGRPEVVVLPTAAAYEHPERAVDTAARWFAGFGAEVSPCMVLGRGDADDARLVEQVRMARMIYLSGGSPLHLRSVLKDSPVWTALRTAWAGGATVVGSSAGAMVLCDPMVDPRGGALTLGLGLVEHLAVLPHAASWSPGRAQRTFDLATGHLRIAAVDERTALVREPGGAWRVAGAGSVTVYVDGRPTGLAALDR